MGKFVQIIHQYRNNMLAKIKNPIRNGILEIDSKKAIKLSKAGDGKIEHVTFYDEAQRSWTHKRLSDYFKQGETYGSKLKIKDFPLSKAVFLIRPLDQREDWATILYLIGGGQEIKTGEAGISKWIKTLNVKFSHWRIYDKLTEKEYADGKLINY